MHPTWHCLCLQSTSLGGLGLFIFKWSSWAPLALHHRMIGEIWYNVMHYLLWLNPSSSCLGQPLSQVTAPNSQPHAAARFIFLSHHFYHALFGLGHENHRRLMQTIPILRLMWLRKNVYSLTVMPTLTWQFKKSRRWMVHFADTHHK